jgi:HEAT repeat protein
MSEKSKIPFSEIIAALLDTSQPFSPVHLHRFSDLEKRELRELKNVWTKIDPSRRLALLSDLEEMADVDTLMDFDPVAMIGLRDSEGNVRARAAMMLWEYQGTDLAHTLVTMVEEDSAVEARAAAASALGKYIYLGEIEEIPAKILHAVEGCLLKAAQGSDDPLVQRKALEALGFSSRDDIPPLIRKAYDSRVQEWVVSALFAMGRSYDKVWEPDVKRELRSPKGDIQLEAVRAAGALGLDSTKRILLDLLEEEGTDSEIRAEVIWALSEIGGEEVRETLEELLEKTEDEEEADLIEEALDNLDLNEQIESLDLFDIDLEEEARSARIVDLSLEDPNPDSEKKAEDESENPAKKTRPRHKKSN